MASLLLAAMAVAASAQVVTLSDGNTVVMVDPLTPLGIFSWTVDGVDHCNNQWFFFRVGDQDPEASIDTLPGTIIESTDQTLSMRYESSDFSLTVDITLQGEDAGSGRAHMQIVLTPVNTSQQPLDLHLFEYADMDIDGDFDNNTFVMLREELVTQTGPAGSVLTRQSSPRASHAGIADYLHLRDELGDTLPTTVHGDTGPIVGDMEYGIQWDLSLDPGGSVPITIEEEFDPGPPADADGDQILDSVDNCPAVANPGQQDSDDNGVGDLCDQADGGNGGQPTTPLCGSGVAQVTLTACFVLGLASAGRRYQRHDR